MREISTGKVSLGANDCIQIFDFIKNFYKGLNILFIDLKPEDKKVEKFQIYFITIAKSFENIISFKRYIYSLNSSSKKTL